MPAVRLADAYGSGDFKGCVAVAAYYVDPVSYTHLTIIASQLNGMDFYARPPVGERFVLVIGNEARGISSDVLACADLHLKLPMRGGAESLNAAIAAAIMMYDLMNAPGRG